MATKDDKTIFGKSHYSWFIANISSILGKKALYSEPFRQSGLYNYQWKIKCQLVMLKKQPTLLVELIQWNQMRGEVKVKGSISVFLQLLDANQRVLRFYDLKPSDDQHHFKVQIPFDFEEKLTVEGGIFIRCWVTELSTNRELCLKDSSNVFEVKRRPIFEATKSDELLKILGNDNLLKKSDVETKKDSHLSKDLYKNSNPRDANSNILNENALTNDYQSKTKSLVLETNPNFETKLISNVPVHKLRTKDNFTENGNPTTLVAINESARNNYPVIVGTTHYGSKPTISADYEFKSPAKNENSEHIDLNFNKSDKNSNPRDTNATISKENALTNDYQSKPKSLVLETNPNFETKPIKLQSLFASDKNGNFAEINNPMTFVANNDRSLHSLNHFPIDESATHYGSKPIIPKDYRFKSPEKTLKLVDWTFDKSDIPYFGKQMFNKQWGVKFQSDMIFVTRQRLFHCHKIVLSSESLILKDWFLKNKSRFLDISDSFDDETILDLLHYIYTREAPNIRKTAQDLMRVSLLYDLSELRNQCINAILSCH